MNTGMRSSRFSQARSDRWVELACLVALLLVAAFFRFHRPGVVPPGPSHDELRMIDLGELIVEGERPIHWTVSYSAEPLFMYVLALVMPVWGFTPFGARIVTRFAGLLLIPLVHRLGRRLFGRRVALVASGVLAVTWWPVFFSRVALRGITLPVVFVAALYVLWRGLRLDGTEGTCRVGPVRWGWLALAGVLMGLTWYTFTAARGLFVLLPALLAHLALVRAVPIERLWRIALVALGLAVLIAAPFVYEMQVHPGAPEARMKQLGGVIEELRAGNLAPFIRQTAATLGMFALRGDPNWRYSVSGRPVFGPVLGALATLGFLVSIVRWRQPRYFLLLLWLLLGLAPSMLTPDAPSLVRAIGALPAGALLPGVGAVTLWDWVAARVRPRARLQGAGSSWIGPLLVVLVLVVNGFSTFHDLFIVWPVQPQVRAIYQAALTEAFQDLNHSSLEGPIWISEPFPDDRNLLLAQRVLQRKEIKPRWFDGSRAWILPSSDGLRRYLLADFAVPDPALFARWLDGAAIVLERESPEQTDQPAYRLYQVEGGPWVEQELAEITARSAAFADPAAQQPVPLPARFGTVATLLGYELADDRLAPGQEVRLTLYWRADGPVYEPLSSFAHLLDRKSTVVGQYDGFDVPPYHWEPGAVIAQIYRFPVGQDAQPGAHWLEVGLYNPQTMERVPVVDDAGAPVSERLLLREIIVQ
jgi:4-amino-4-deoxy-L-arabinose transferase-like glycosyltransferase